MEPTQPPVDWKAVEQSPAFAELISARRRFVLPATIFFLAWYVGFVLLAGYAPDFMGDSVYEGLTVGYCLALTQFLMVFVLGYLYLRRAETVFDPLAEKVVEQALATAQTHGPGTAADGDANGAHAPPAAPTMPTVPPAPGDPR